MDGLKDYQFVQTSDKGFQILAEISKDADKKPLIIKMMNERKAG